MASASKYNRTNQTSTSQLLLPPFSDAKKAQVLYLEQVLDENAGGGSGVLLCQAHTVEYAPRQGVRCQQVCKQCCYLQLDRHTHMRLGRSTPSGEEPAAPTRDQKRSSCLLTLHALSHPQPPRLPWLCSRSGLWAEGPRPVMHGLALLLPPLLLMVPKRKLMSSCVARACAHTHNSMGGPPKFLTRRRACAPPRARTHIAELVRLQAVDDGVLVAEALVEVALQSRSGVCRCRCVGQQQSRRGSTGRNSPTESTCTRAESTCTCTPPHPRVPSARPRTPLPRAQERLRLRTPPHSQARRAYRGACAHPQPRRRQGHAKGSTLLASTRTHAHTRSHTHTYVGARTVWCHQLGAAAPTRAPLALRTRQGAHAATSPPV